MPSSTKMILFVVSLAMFMESLDATIINTAIPVMSLSLHVNPIDLKIALISYLLSLAILIPISGWLADKYGSKRVFMIALGIFTLSSLWCGFSHKLWELVIARTLQGVGGALMMPVGRLILFRTFERRQVMTMTNRVVMLASLGLMLGPVLGGVITHYYSWRWIFWVNIPVGLLAMLMTHFFMAEAPPQAVAPLDKWGFILFGMSLAAFTFGLSAFSESALRPSWALLIVLAAVFLLIIYVWHSRHRSNAIVKPELFRFRTFQVSTISNLITRVGFGGLPFLLPILLQVGLGYSILTSGFLLAPIALGVLLIKPLSVGLLRFFGYKKLLILNTVLVALSLMAFTQINHHSSVYVIALLTFFFGFLISMQYSAMNSLAYAEILPNQLSAVTSIMGTLVQLAQSFGVAISALFIHYFSAGSGKTFLLTPTVFHQAFSAMGVLTLLSTFIFMRLHPEDGRQMVDKQE
jgi:EmrB/QacA subfamily drug resistance transporter